MPVPEERGQGGEVGPTCFATASTTGIAPVFFYEMGLPPRDTGNAPVFFYEMGLPLGTLGMRPFSSMKWISPPRDAIFSYHHLIKMMSPELRGQVS